MTEPTACCVARSASANPYCDNCDLLVGLYGLHVLDVEQGPDRLRVMVESAPSLMGCSGCGVVAVSHGRRRVELIDAPSFGRPVRVIWRKRTWSCPEPVCPVGTFTEQDQRVAAPRVLLTARACWWAVQQLRREHASVAGLARQLGTTWRTVWRAIKPLLETMSADQARFDSVAILGVDEHIWHHVSTKVRGPKELTGMVDLTRDEHGNTRARLLDLVPGRSGSVYRNWLTTRGETFRARVKVATLDPFHGYKNAIDDQLQDATAVVDAFHVVKLGGHAVDEVRRRVQQQTTGHRGRAGDPLYGIRTILRAGQDHHQDVPEVVVTVGSGSIGIPRGVKLGHFAPERWVRGQDSVHELFVGGEGLARGGREVLGTLLHEAGHGLALVRGIQDTSRQGRYHNERYRRLGVELGLVLGKDPGIGWSLTQVPDATAELYGQQIGLIDAALVAYRRGEVQGGRGGRTSNNNGVAAACDCGRRLRLSRAVYDAGPITCGLCGQRFTTSD